MFHHANQEQVLHRFLNNGQPTPPNSNHNQQDNDELSDDDDITIVPMYEHSAPPPIKKQKAFETDAETAHANVSLEWLYAMCEERDLRLERYFRIKREQEARLGELIAANAYLSDTRLSLD